MIRLTIDNKTIEMEDGRTVLDACEEMGINIPTMCFMKGLKHFTSCMICVVRDTRTNRLIPACSALAENDMTLETDSEPVRKARKDALDLLISEHTGDCEAPCTLVCPAGINIPRMIRHIRKGNLNEAGAIAAENTISTSDPCKDCNTRCEKPCRRNQVDSPVSIRNLVSFALSSNHADTSAQTVTPRKKIFNCSIGRLLPGELDEFLKGADRTKRIEPADSVFTAEEARREASRCLHCDCHKADSCRLRLYADEYGADKRRYRPATRRHAVRMTDHPEIIFEPAKCIKCGLCVRITARAEERLGLTFSARGYDSEISVPFNEPFAIALEKTALECADACPTAALTRKTEQEI